MSPAYIPRPVSLAYMTPAPPPQSHRGKPERDPAFMTLSHFFILPFHALSQTLDLFDNCHQLVIKNSCANISMNFGTSNNDIHCSIDGVLHCE